MSRDETPDPDAGARETPISEKPTKRRRMVRDLGGIERVWLEWTPGESGMFATLMVQEAGRTDRMLSVEPQEIGRLIEVLEQARDELPESDADPYLGAREVSEADE